MYKKKLALAIGIITSLISMVSYAENDTIDTKIKNDQAKVIVYRGNMHNFAQSKNAKIYFDGKHVANLGKDDYVEFCTSPDKHTITSHLESALFYSDKNKKHLTNELNAGNTYIIRINDDINGNGELLLSGDLNATEQLKDKNKKTAIAQNIVECKPDVEISSPTANSIEEKKIHKDGSSVAQPLSELPVPVDKTTTNSIIEPSVQNAVIVK
jgi:hypothetical protein